ncbi:hypothetical protein BKA01_003372 [Pseudonocardia eucalypti]|nr:hypothetical protein [Pseudonocardia eucalypti]
MAKPKRSRRGNELIVRVPSEPFPLTPEVCRQLLAIINELYEEQQRTKPSEAE